MGPVDLVAYYLDSGESPISIFTDLPNAFDTLNHTILLKKTLEYYTVWTPPDSIGFEVTSPKDHNMGQHSVCR